MATSDNGKHGSPDKRSPQTELFGHQIAQSMVQQTNSPRDKDVIYPPNIPVDQYSKPPPTSTGYEQNVLSSKGRQTRHRTPEANVGELLPKVPNDKNYTESGTTSVHGRTNIENGCRLHMVGQNFHENVERGVGSKMLNPLSASYKETVHQDNVASTILTNDHQENMVPASEDLYPVKASPITDWLNILIPFSSESFTKNSNEIEVDFCMKTFNVLVKKWRAFTCGTLEVINELDNDNSVWSASGGKCLIVEHFRFENLRAGLMFLPSKTDTNKGGRFTACDNTIEMAVPNMVNGGQTDYKELETILSKALEKASAGRNITTVAFRLCPVANWDFDNLMKCMVGRFVDWLLTSSFDKLRVIYLCTELHNDFICTNKYLDCCLRTKMEETQLKPPTVRIVKGSLDQANADVVVNTAAHTLDLSFGKVSSVLLNAAGQELQKECTQRYPTGIGYDEIAVTDGYKLHCKNVFHVTLQTKDRSTKGFIQSIRKTMLRCLKAASDYEYRSIAFPAMGTGSLGYPSREVASEMITAIERFTIKHSRPTTLEEVQLVIFPSDTDLFQTFQSLEKKLVRKTVSVQSQMDVVLKFKLTGLRQNVENCKAWLTSIFKTSMKDTVSECTEKSGAASERSSTLSNPFWSKHTLSEQYHCGQISVRVYEANILDVPVDCIVNAADSGLQNNCGIASDIAKAAGWSLTQECTSMIKEKGRLPVTSVVSTRPGNLGRYKCVLHAVGPHYAEHTPITKSNLEKCEHDLHETIRTCLVKASDMQLKTIALPIIIPGRFRVPMEVCAIQYAKVVKEFSSTRSSLREIHFVDKNSGMIDIMRTMFDVMIANGKPPPIDTSKFIENTATTGAEGIGRGETFKNTARDHPKSVAKASNINPERVLSVNASHKSNSMKLTCKLEADTKLEVQIYESDIIDLKDIDAVVCSEDRTGNAKGVVARLLLGKGGNEYKQEKANGFRCLPTFGDIITTRGGRNNYTWIMHAIISRKDPNIIPMMYQKIFEELESNKLTSVALPLLGTGAGVDPKSCSETLFSELIQLCQTKRRYAFTIHVVINQKQIADIVKDVFQRGIVDIKEKPKNEQETERTASGHIEGETAKTHKGAVISNEKAETNNDCVICMDTVTDAKTLECGHMFCAECIDGYFRVKKVCPTCGKVCGTVTGDQPDGSMIIGKHPLGVAGFERYKSIVISYSFLDGKQRSDHPRPGAPYKGIRRTAYLPDNEEGRRICAMLEIAFTRRLVFTIGTSRTTGKECVITWNDIHHKTDKRPNTQFGYPDETYLQRVREELEVKGVTLKDVEAELIEDLKDENFKKTVMIDTQ